MINRIRIALIHALGGIDKPLPFTISSWAHRLDEAINSTSGATSGNSAFKITATSTTLPKTKRWWTP